MAHCFHQQELNCRCTPDNPYHLYAKSILGIKTASAVKVAVGTRRKREFIPEEQKDGNYWFKRNRNNEAAKRSRQRKRMEEYLLETRAVQLFHENEELKAALSSVKYNSSDRPPHYDSVKPCFYESRGAPSFLPPSQPTAGLGMDLWPYERTSRLSRLPPLAGVGPPSVSAGTDMLPVFYFSSDNLSGNCTPTCPLNHTGNYSPYELAQFDVRQKCPEKLHPVTLDLELNGVIPPLLNQRWGYQNPTGEAAPTDHPVKPLDNLPAWMSYTKDAPTSDPRGHAIHEVSNDIERVKPGHDGPSAPLLPHKLRFKTSRLCPDSSRMAASRCAPGDKLQGTREGPPVATEFPLPSAQYLWYAERHTL